MELLDFESQSAECGIYYSGSENNFLDYHGYEDKSPRNRIIFGWCEIKLVVIEVSLNWKPFRLILRGSMQEQNEQGSH